MATWATKRKVEYVSVVFAVLILFVGLPAFLYFYKPPTCFDGMQNQDEKGIDCGGICKKLCQSDFLPAVVLWTDFEKVAPGLYNVAAYIENPNINAAAANVPYQFSVFDGEGVLIIQVRGLVTIPANRNTLAFVGAVDLGKRKPSKGGITFSFLQPPLWHVSHDGLAKLLVADKKYNEDSLASSLQVTLKNTGLLPFTNVSVFSILADADGNHLAFSKTFMDQIVPGGQVVAPFTWPFSNGGKVVSQEILPFIDPVFDAK
jgi:hypothetical protein